MEVVCIFQVWVPVVLSKWVAGRGRLVQAFMGTTGTSGAGGSQDGHRDGFRSSREVWSLNIFTCIKTIYSRLTFTHYGIHHQSVEDCLASTINHQRRPIHLSQLYWIEEIFVPGAVIQGVFRMKNESTSDDSRPQTTPDVSDSTIQLNKECM